MIKVIIFDFGGVLTESGAFYEMFLTIHPETVSKTSEEVRAIIAKHWKSARTDEITADEFFENCAKDIGCSKDGFKKTALTCMARLNNDMITLVKKLEKNYKVALLSNHISEILKEVLKINKLDKLFDKIIISSDINLAKPDEEIYKKAVEILKVSPEECIFIDDQKENLINANKIGMKPILFKNQKELEEKLEELL